MPIENQRMSIEKFQRIAIWKIRELPLKIQRMSNKNQRMLREKWEHAHWKIRECQEINQRMPIE